MALFKRKPGDGEQPQDNGEGRFVPQPEKARKWFEHAQAAAVTSNFEYALECYAYGIRIDPEVMSAHEAMLAAAVKYNQSGGKAASGKEIKRIDDGTPIARFAGAEYAWMKELPNASLALKALEAAAKAQQLEWAAWIARRILNVVKNQKKPTKAQFVQAKDLFQEVQAWDEALEALQLAKGVDPRDASLDAELKDLSAQRAMSQGGYEAAAGEEGGFRRFIKDSERQQQLLEQETISATASIEERNFLRAKAAYEASPTLPEAINQYAQQLKKQNKMREAFDIYMKGFADTREYRFRLAAGDIRIEEARQKCKAIREQLEATPGPPDAALQQQLKDADVKRLEIEAAEFRERIEKYPTNRPMRFDYGTVLFELGRYEEAMESFQASKDEPRLRVRAGHYLGRCFAASGWHDEAVLEFEEALKAIDVPDADLEQSIRYDLMLSVIEQSRVNRSLDLAKKAKDIASVIMRKSVSYRDIKDKRNEIEELIRTFSS